MKSQPPSGSIDSFGTFLRKLNTAHAQRNTSKHRATSEMFEEREDEAIRAGWRQMVRVLSTKGPTPVPELMAESGLGFAAFTRALESARSNDLVKLESHGSQERAALTDIGEKIANLSY